MANKQNKQIPKILVANVGNRNFKWQGDFIDTKDDFRGITKCIYDYIQTEKDNLEISIIGSLLTKLQTASQIDKIILFGSNQEGFGDSKHVTKDTLYAARILSSLIKDTYNINTEVKEIKCNIREVDKLFEQYQTHLNEIKSENPEANIIVCDSGGTPQQKTTLRIVAEYLLEASKFEFWQVYEILDEKGNVIDSEAQKYASKAYKTIIDNKQVILLIEKGNYQAAAAIYGSEGTTEDRISKQLKAVSLRKQLLLHDAKTIVNRMRDDSLLPSLKTLKNSSLGDYTKWQDYFERSHFNMLAETLSVADFFYHHLKDYNNTILYYHIFMEKCLNALISKKLPNYDLMQANSYKENAEKLLIYLKGNNLISANSSHLSLPVKQTYVKTNIINKNNDIDKCINYFFQWCNGYFSNHRNKIAHEGMGIKDETVLKSISINFATETKDWYSLFGLPHKNIYLQTNEEITKALKLN